MCFLCKTFPSKLRSKLCPHLQQRIDMLEKLANVFASDCMFSAKLFNETFTGVGSRRCYFVSWNGRIAFATSNGNAFIEAVEGVDLSLKLVTGSQNHLLFDCKLTLSPFVIFAIPQCFICTPVVKHFAMFALQVGENFPSSVSQIFCWCSKTRENIDRGKKQCRKFGMSLVLSIEAIAMRIVWKKAFLQNDEKKNFYQGNETWIATWNSKIIECNQIWKVCPTLNQH